MIRSFKIEIKKSHKIWSRIDYLSLQSKYLYNTMLYEYNEYAKNNDDNYPNVIDGRKLCQNREEWYKLENTKCSNRLWKQVFLANISAYKNSLKSYYKDKTKFKGRPQKPKYLKGKEKGRFLLIYDKENISKPKLEKEHKLKFCNIDYEFTLPEWFDYKLFRNCIIKPAINQSYVIIVNYLVEDKENIFPKGHIGIDLGINNLMTITFSDFSQNPIIINGKPLKSINQYYNKLVSKYQKSAKICNNLNSTKRIRRITDKRNKKVDSYINKCTKFVAKLANSNDSDITIGYNKGWKQSANLGKKTNQKFVQIPFEKIRNQLQYKCENYGRSVILQEESYTSKASSLDLDKIPTYKEDNKVTYTFSGKRIKRGLYETKEKLKINADVNGSLNILRKCNPKFFIENWIEDVVVHPMILIPEIISMEKS